MDDLPATVRALIVPTTPAESGPLFERNSNDLAPIGSIFKLYVLLAVADAIAAAELDWDTVLTVTEQNRSLPSGELQDAPDGTEVTVREAATKMIAISDNTATDMLIHAVGRDAVEQAVADSGHHAPEAMTPFPTTRELFHIGWGEPADRELWANGSTGQQRELLEDLAHQPIDGDDLAVGGDPLWPDGVEWFASAQDIAAAHTALQSLDDPIVDEIMSENPGVSQTSWEYVAYKGGSSPGVLAGSWFVEDADGQGYIMVLQSATADAAGISSTTQDAFFRLASAALELTHGQ